MRRLTNVAVAPTLRRLVTIIITRRVALWRLALARRRANMTDDSIPDIRTAPTWYGALGRRANTPGRPVAVPTPSGDPMLDLVRGWQFNANKWAGPPDSMKSLALLYSRETDEMIAALGDPPVPTTLEGAAAALDLVLAEGVLAGEGVAIVRAVAEALQARSL